MKSIFDLNYSEYENYLINHCGNIPQDLFEILIQQEYYDPYSHKCPHDGALQTLQISQSSMSENNNFVGKLNIIIEILNAFKDFKFIYSYKNVKKYILNYPGLVYDSSHGDWLMDRIEISETNKITHNILFSSKAKFKIECDYMSIEFVKF